MRGLRTISTLLALLLPVQAMASESISAERIEGFVAVMEANGCRMSPLRADEVMPGAGYGDNVETKAITEHLITHGRARILDGALVVFGDSCGAQLQYSGRERFFAGMADNGCMMTSDQAKLILPRVGVEMREVQLLMEPMLAMSEVRLSDDEKTVFLEQSLCDKYKGLSSEIAAAEPVEPPKPTTAETRAAFLKFMASVDCKMTRAESSNVLPRAGFNAKEMRPIILKLIKDGHAEMTGEDDTLTISKEICQ